MALKRSYRKLDAPLGVLLTTTDLPIYKLQHLQFSCLAE